MKMLVFYRSKECSNSIVSSTMAKLKQHPELSTLDVEFVNLDKRNYVKVLKNMAEESALPKFVYIWYDEEKVTDYINETYPDIEVIHFNMKAVNKLYSGYRTSNDYQLINMIIQKFKDNLVKREVYVVDEKRNFTISKEIMDELDAGSCANKVFDSEEEAKDYCVKKIVADIHKKTEDIEYYQAKINAYKKDIKQMKSVLAKKFNFNSSLPF